MVTEAKTPLQPRSLDVFGVKLDYFEGGTGTPLVILHGAGGPRGDAPFIQMLASQARVIAPIHPGFASSELPDWIDSVDDLAYLYLDFFDLLDLKGAVLLGQSMGGWTAAEIATKSTARLSKLILTDAVGIKVGDRETRDIPDIWALPPAEVAKLTFYDPSKAPDPATMSDEQLLLMARNREAAALYLWEPYMHNPKLRRRLHRINIPTLLIWGERDGLASPEYGKAYCASIPGARIEFIEKAGHTPHNEQPKAFVDAVLRFMKG